MDPENARSLRGKICFPLFQIKEANLLGTTYQYAIFEAQYDQGA